jgi:hypothetical protein
MLREQHASLCHAAALYPAIAFFAAGVSSSPAAVGLMTASAKDITSWAGLERPLTNGKIHAAAISQRGSGGLSMAPIPQRLSSPG